MQDLFSAESEGLAALVFTSFRLEPDGSHPISAKQKKALLTQDLFFSGE